MEHRSGKMDAMRWEEDRPGSDSLRCAAGAQSRWFFKQSQLLHMRKLLVNARVWRAC